VRVERLTIDGDPAAVAARVRGLVPAMGAAVSDEVAAIVAAVRDGGDEALAHYGRELDGLDGPVVVPRAELDAALRALDPGVRAGLKVAIANVGEVAEAGLAPDREVRLPQGHTVTLRETPVRRAAIYVPGGRAPYPSTVVMGVITARVAGVNEIVVCTPQAQPVVLAACALCGVDAVLRVGGAHAVAALAYGTPTIERVDVIAGPGNEWVQEAKRQVSGDVGIDGFLGPSDVVVFADATADPALIGLDLLAQAEHGEGTIVVVVSADEALLGAIDLSGGGETGAVAALVHAATLNEALAFAEAFAPEHLELVGRAAEALAPRVRGAGAVFVGAASAVAFGDYVAGSNHSLPTGGTARFASGLSVRHFRRRYSEVRIGDRAATALAEAGAPIARAEGFGVHADSMLSRENVSP
jgi:histidinol dehydrogenase